jgi:hypothetical protein
LPPGSLSSRAMSRRASSNGQARASFDAATSSGEMAARDAAAGRVDEVMGDAAKLAAFLDQRDVAAHRRSLSGNRQRTMPRHRHS